jgi:hypothetical protein
VRGRLFAAGAAGFVMAAGLAAPAAAGSHAEISVLHGVPDLTVDVWVSGERTLDDVAPGDLAGPLVLPHGTHRLSITAADSTDEALPAIGPLDLPLEPDVSYTAVAHLDSDGAPTATLFTNDSSGTATGEGRLTVRHTAAAPAVDVLAGGTVVMSGLENGDEQVLTLPVGTVSAAVAAAGTTEPVIGPADVRVAEGVSTIVYAWGSLAGGDLALATQTIERLQPSPSGVPGGQQGLVADPVGPSVPAWSYALVAVAAALLIGLVGRNRAGGTQPWPANRDARATGASGRGTPT